MRKLVFSGLACTLAAAVATVGAALAQEGPKAAKSYGAEREAKSVAELEARHKAFLSALDANADGVITPEERQAYRAAKAAERRKAMFPDKNADGLVDRFEWEEAARARFDRLDANGDGYISEEEFAQAAKGRRDRSGKRQ